MAVAATSWTPGIPFQEWSLDRAVKVLNDSPWARHETFTRVIRGVGSGISGEKEIYNTFYVRFLSPSVKPTPVSSRSSTDMTK